MHFPRVQRWLEKTEAQVDRHRNLMQRYGWVGLAGFVLLPLPGTGVWGGVVLARILQMSKTGVWLGLSLGAAVRWVTGVALFVWGDDDGPVLLNTGLTRALFATVHPRPINCSAETCG